MKAASAALLCAISACSAGQDAGQTVARARTDTPPVFTGSDSDNGGQLPPAGEDLASPAANEDEGCGLETFSVERRPAEVLLVLDRSGSMRDPPDDDDDDDGAAAAEGTKWDFLVPALEQVIQQTDAGVSWGIKLFPEGQDTDACSAETLSDEIHVPIRDRNASAVLAAIAGTTPDGDGTPTGDALQAATAYMSTRQSDNPRFILLATDGEPSCSPSGEGQEEARPYAVGAVRGAAQAGVPVFVVGVATNKDTAAEALDDMAAAGGVPRSEPGSSEPLHYLANNQAELVSALSAITGQISTCVFPLAKPPPVPDNIGVKLDGVLLARDPARQHGWDYTDESHLAVELHGAPCTELQTAAASAVQVIYACAGVIIR